MRPGVSICFMSRTAIATCAFARERLPKRRRTPMNVLLFASESPTIIILVVAAIFLLFGGSKLPQLAKALGQSKKAFKEGIDEADGKSDRSKLESVDDEALFEEARRRAQQVRADEAKKIDR